MKLRDAIKPLLQVIKKNNMEILGMKIVNLIQKTQYME